MAPADIERAVEDRMNEYPDLPQERKEVRVGEEQIEGVAIWPVPGQLASTEVYVPVEDRVYTINVYGEHPEEELERLLRSVRFFEPTRSVESLNLGEASGASLSKLPTTPTQTAARETA